jgi:hypothetical protein
VYGGDPLGVRGGSGGRVGGIGWVSQWGGSGGRVGGGIGWVYGGDRVGEWGGSGG